MIDFNKVAKVKYSNMVLGVVDVVKFGRSRVVSLEDDYFIIENGIGQMYFVSSSHGALTDEERREVVWRAVGRDSLGYDCSMDCRATDDPNWFEIEFAQNRFVLTLQGEQIQETFLDVY
jgi:hypothetical protein